MFWINAKLITPRVKTSPTKLATARRGAVIPLVLVFIIVLFAMAAFSIDVAYMQLVNTQLRATTDIAAKAGTSYLMQGKTDTQAINYAISIAAQNNVAGHPLYLTSSDITLGQPQLQNDGSWSFVAGLKPSQAMQVNSKLLSSNSNGAVALFFSPLLGTRTFSTSTTSVASAMACDLSLVLDRSGSMKWDMSGTDWMYPSPYYSDWNTGYYKPPVSGSRWWCLDSAVSNFTSIVNTSNSPPRIGVITWASDVKTDLDFTTNMTTVQSAVHYYSSNNFQGGTDMSDGMAAGLAQLTGSSSRSYAKKFMVLMSDGQWNEGSDPTAYASTCVSNHITVYTVSLLTSGSGTTVLQTIASTTGGKSYQATDSATLNAAFADIAYSLPIVLTK